MIKLPFKKLKIWRNAMDLAKEIYLLTKFFPKEEMFGLTSQMKRSAISVPSNIAEGSQRTSDKDFANFILISKGSLAELETQLLLSFEIEYVKKDFLDKVILQIEELDRMLYSFYLSLKTNR